MDFRQDIAPIVRSRCGTCHGKDKEVRLEGEEAYETLGRFLVPGKARTSRLIWHLFGRNTARPWDGAAAGEPARPLPLQWPAHATVTMPDRSRSFPP